MMIAPDRAPVAAPRALRADARRNYERILGAARETFAEQGASACLDEIARRAGVGIGTLYRRFPTRRELVEALLHDDIAELSRYGDRLLASPSPGEALSTWLRAVVAHAVASQGLMAELLPATGDVAPHPSSTCEEMQAVGALLLARAQAASDVRDDVTADDLFALVNGLAWATEKSTSNGAVDRLLDVMLAGLKRG
jgi:AcrR family transcriptional regulator